MGQLKHCVEAGKRQPPNLEIQNSLKQEPVMDLMKEVALLELEIVYLERCLLSMYRKKFDQEVSSLSTMDETLKSNSSMHKGKFAEVPGHEITSKKDNSVIHSRHHVSPLNSVDNRSDDLGDKWAYHGLVNTSIHRSHSSLSHRSARFSPPVKCLANAIDSHYSLPLSMLKKAQSSNPDHIGTCTCNHGLETPNDLSEEMIRCISAIYCELADPPLINPNYSSSPISYSSSVNGSPAQGQGNMWSPQSRKFSTFKSNFDNPFHIRESNEFNGPYCMMAKVERICRDSQKLRDVEHKLRKFRTLVYRLEQVDPGKLKHEEKLAFWINAHNAIVMHAFLVYGIPQSSTKRMSILLKAAYNVGGHDISIDMIQTSILGCQLPRPGQWLRVLFSSKIKFKIGDARRAYALEHPEPRLCFALCSGSYSDPVVRVYTSKRIFEELETAKEEYIQSSLSLRKENKILLPRIVETFAKDSDLCPAGLVEMVEHFMPDFWRKNIRQCQQKKLMKNIEWISHNFAFRYLLSKELVQ
ncbi:hypothetical protein HS088_TW07G01235 [Tripterygium wilfordii]|uniref:DUF547 domain-containing protein n=1 Tax=Tripterygium wilfordii TaxID=458696 RepID=A0A7J7DH57_TRIWF|nr:uncharacterized protein LOC120002159 [Tripterygium wilfordii]KAF5745643.1 hypothetical protein HS088_TW07G01235 [Tripterygium wilfordii]